MLTQRQDFTSDTENELRSTYRYLKASTQFVRQTRIAIRSWMLQALGKTSSTEEISQELAIIKTGDKLAQYDSKYLYETLIGIDNIGPKLANKLTNKFGSLEAIKSASIKNIQEVHGIGDKLAKTIKIYLNKNTI